MPNEKNKKVIDYSKFFEKEKKEEKPASRKKHKISIILDLVKKFWFQSEKKTKIELIILLGMIVLIIIVLILYLFEPKTLEFIPPPLPAE